MAGKLTYEDVQDLYRQHGPGLLAYGTNMLGDRAAAEDVLHQVFLKLLAADRLPAEPRPYLFKAVRNRALNALRSSARLTSLDGQEWLVKPHGMMEAGLEIEQVMRDLPQEQREVVVLHIWGEMTLAEVVAAFQLPPAQTRERLNGITGRIQDFNPAVQAFLPSFSRLNDNREKLIGERNALLKALK